MRALLDRDGIKTLASAFILPRLEYCNSLSAKITEEGLNKPQVLQNNTARLVFRRHKRACNITSNRASLASSKGEDRIQTCNVVF